MQSALPLGTVLQRRYRLIDLLGQGGFGRTYLAEDLGRFNERCALKEFIPPETGNYPFEKSQELFQREAQVLYQIRHPQIPQFCAVFEDGHRLFLVQDYVEGKTYHTLLNERRTAGGRAFSEAEIVLFLKQMLPVLSYIHSLGVIHRDISPDNIILRQRDQLPVLIDFGVVNEIVTQVQSQIQSQNLTLPPATRVGKVGYAPIEQLQMGKVSLSSDLYALAVTTIVLMTGQEPQHLMDQNTLTWNWQRWVNVSPELAYVINRMLSRQPGDRYQSALEVEKALATSGTASGSSNPSVPLSLSEMKTVAVGRPAINPAAPATSPSTPQPSRGIRQSLWENPLAAITSGIVIALLTGWGSWVLVNALIDSTTRTRPKPPPIEASSPEATPTPIPEPIPEPTPTPEFSPTPIPPATPEPPPLPKVLTRRLKVVPGEPTVIEGYLKSNETVNYLISASQGQQLYTDVAGRGVLLTLLDPRQNPVDSRAEGVSVWQGTLSADGDYTIQLRTLPGLPESNYVIEIEVVDSLPPISPTPAPDPDPRTRTHPNPLRKPLPYRKRNPPQIQR
ncbi:MAG: serine/threonine protein kinase [Oscillatoriales cyanobacterium RM1_1_9]|nr:serine/threonine protein kinase [Oscillatoriales cyanobacterium RM1_1_9]